jgi:ribosomal protein S18 acetylase RimI-like enzyme
MILPTPVVTLAEVAEDEVGAVAEMASRIWPVAYGAILPPGQIDFMLAKMYAPARLLQDQEEGVAFLWILAEGERTGFLAAGPVTSDGACPLHKLYLLPGSQRGGLGSLAVAQLCERLAGSGARSLELRVNRHNATAIAFYRKNGFTVFAEDCREIGGGYVMDDYLMRRELA